MKWTMFLMVAGACALGAAAFEVTTVPEEIPEAGIYTRTRITEGKTQFSFIAPKGWAPSSDAAAKRISLQSFSPEATFTVRLSTNAYPATAAKFKEQLLASGAYKDLSVTDEFRASAGSGGGYGVDMRHLVADRFPMNTRLAVFQAPEGTVEVSLSAPNTPIATLHPIWTGFINSFRIETKTPAPK